MRRIKRDVNERGVQWIRDGAISKNRAPDVPAIH